MTEHTTKDIADEKAPGTCLLCHTVDAAMTQGGLDNGTYWRCQRCGQMWDAQRIAAANEYSLTQSRERDVRSNDKTWKLQSASTIHETSVLIP